MKKNPKKKLFSIDSDTDENDTPMILLNDNSDDEDLNCPVYFGDFVLVKYEGKKFYKYFVGCVEDINNDDITVSFLKRKIGDTFYYPAEQEIDNIPQSFIEKILPKPKPVGGSERSAFLLKFESIDFTKYKMG